MTSMEGDGVVYGTMKEKRELGVFKNQVKGDQTLKSRSACHAGDHPTRKIVILLQSLSPTISRATQHETQRRIIRSNNLTRDPDNNAQYQEL